MNRNAATLWLILPLCLSLIPMTIWPSHFAAAQQHNGHPQEHLQLHRDFYRKLLRPDVPLHFGPAMRSIAPIATAGQRGHASANSAGKSLMTEWRSIPSATILNDKSPTCRHMSASPEPRRRFSAS
jgi:hypothetical protein